MPQLKAIQLRQATENDAEAIAAVRIEAWRHTYQHIVPSDYLAQMSMDESLKEWQIVLQAYPQNEHKICVYVAESEGQIVGFASAMQLPEPKLGMVCEINAIYVRPDWQRCGIGSKMMHKLARTIKEWNASSALMWVIDGNKMAREFCQSQGGKILMEQDYQWDELELTELAYAWSDVNQLILHE